MSSPKQNRPERWTGPVGHRDAWLMMDQFIAPELFGSRRWALARGRMDVDFSVAPGWPAYTAMHDDGRTEVHLAAEGTSVMTALHEAAHAFMFVWWPELSLHATRPQNEAVAVYWQACAARLRRHPCQALFTEWFAGCETALMGPDHNEMHQAVKAGKRYAQLLSDWRFRTPAGRAQGAQKLIDIDLKDLYHG